MHVSYFKKANQSKKYKVSLVITPLENPRDGGAWWATVYGVAQSRTRLKLLSSCSKILDEVPLNILYYGPD